jgi:hypothetical protein
MTTTLIRTLHLEYDLVEVHYNPHLKNNPYLVRMFSYNNSDPTEIRLDKKELDNLYQTLKNYRLL